MIIAELQRSAQDKQDNPAVLTLWTSGFTGHIANASLRNARLATLIEMLLKANYSTLQDFSIILSGLVLIQTYKSSNVLSVARKTHQLLSLTKSARKTSSAIPKSTGSRTLGLSLHFSTTAASKAIQQSKLISSIFGAQSEVGDSDSQEQYKGIDLAYQLPGCIGASLLREDAESDSFSFSKAENILFSLTNPESQDSFHDNTTDSIFLANRSGVDMQIRAAEGEVVRDASDIVLNDLDTSQAATGNAMHSSLLPKNAFDISNSAILEASKGLTNLFLANTSDRSLEASVVVREIRDSTKKRNSVSIAGKRTKPPSFLFDKQARMHHNTMQKYAYKPPVQAKYALCTELNHILYQAQETVGASDLMFNWSEPEYCNLTTIISKICNPIGEENTSGDACAMVTPTEREGAELELNQSYVEPESPPLNEEMPVQKDSISHEQNEMTENGVTLLTILNKASRPLTISELAGTSRQKAASLFLASLLLRSSNVIIIRQCHTTSFQREISMLLC